MARNSRRRQKQQNQTIQYFAIAIILIVIGWIAFSIFNNSTVGSTTSMTGIPEYNPDELVSTASGLQYLDIETGTGDNPQTGQTVSVHYTGWLTDGTKFDSSVDRGQPFEFPLGTGSVIQGWDEGVAGMQVGGTRLLVIPSDLAYGQTGAGGGLIPGGATLVFQVELLALK